MNTERSAQFLAKIRAIRVNSPDDRSGVFILGA
jgi:hypothetical protein